jgi:tetratricopeptide (TPR) repeat protein
MSAARGLALTLSIGLVATGCAAQHDAKSAHAIPEDKNPDLLMKRGKIFADIGDTVRAEQYFTAALAAGADEMVVAPMFFKVCIGAKHYRLAVDYADGILARHPVNSRLRFLVAALHRDVGENFRAREYFEQAAHELSTDPDVQFLTAVFFRDDLADKIAADPYFREYLKLAPQGAHAEEARASLMVRIQ